METQTINDDQKVVLNGNPVSAVAETPAPCSNFTWINPNPALLDITQVAPFQPNILIKSKLRLVATDPPVETLITLRGFKSNSDPTPHDTQVKVIVQGTLPDDGTFDHFKPVFETPTQQ